MKVNELMIGDLLKWKEQPGFNDEDRNMVLRVKNIFDDAIKIDGRFELYHISLFEPIPLTPEILEKNGFKLDKEDGWWWLTPKIGITFWGEGDIELEFENKHSSVDIHIKYIHQLQHALRLCGINKNIVL